MVFGCIFSPIQQENRRPNPHRTVFESFVDLVCHLIWSGFTLFYILWRANPCQVALVLRNNFFLLQIVCRCSTPLETAVKEKISMFCHVEPEQVICVHDVSSIYRVPLLLEDQGIVEYLCRRLDLPIEMRPRKMLTKWKEISDRFVLFPSTLTIPKTAIFWQFQGCCSCFEWPVFVLRSDRLLEQTSIALVGKYTKLSDSYASVIKALEHSALAINYKLEVKVRNDGATSSNFLYFYDVGDSFVLINFS